MTKTDCEEEISLPKLTVVRMAQELLPKGIILSKDTHDLILACALEFIQLLTFQANEICQKQTRNGFIGLQHVVKACDELGFHEYVREIEAVTAIYDQQLKLMQKKRAQKVGWWSKGCELDDLAIMQARMLEKSKERFEQRLAHNVDNNIMLVDTGM